MKYYFLTIESTDHKKQRTSILRAKNAWEAWDGAEEVIKETEEKDDKDKKEWAVKDLRRIE